MILPLNIPCNFGNKQNSVIAINKTTTTTANIMRPTANPITNRDIKIINMYMVV